MRDMGSVQALKISVCMATYNGSEYLSTQLSSILNQLDSEDELVIVDDASSDDTVSFIQRLNEPRIKLYLNEFNLGVVRTFEKAFLLAKGDLILLSDQDDRWEGNKVTVLRDLFMNEPVDLIVHDARVEGVIVSESLFALCDSSNGVIKNIISNTFTGCCMAFRKSILVEILPIPARRGVFHDAWIGIVASCMGFRISFIPQSLMAYRRHEGNVSTMKTRSYLEIIPDRFGLIYEILRKMPHFLGRRFFR